MQRHSSSEMILMECSTEDRNLDIKTHDHSLKMRELLIPKCRSLMCIFLSKYYADSSKTM